MAILHNPESAFVKEMASWEQRPSEFTNGGLRRRPYKYEDYPKAMYKAGQTASGKWEVAQNPPSRFGFPDDMSWDRACLEAQRFTESCMRIVASEDERARARDEGWRDHSDRGDGVPGCS